MLRLEANGSVNEPVINAVDNQRPKRKQLTVQQRQAILQALIERSEDGILKRGSINAVAGQFNVSRLTVSNLWKRGKESIASGNQYMDISSRKSRCGRKRKDYTEELRGIVNVPLNQRSTVRSTAAALSIPTTTLFRNIKSGEIRSHTNSVKPFLTEQNMRARIEFCMSNINVQRGLFNDMMDVIHVDEKWFYMTQK